jgi:hypothetical protein
MTTKHHDHFPTISETQLTAINGGFLGPLDPIIGFVQRREDKRGFCAEARHWDDNARNEKDPQMKAQFQNYADYKRSLCRAY